MAANLGAGIGNRIRVLEDKILKVIHTTKQPGEVPHGRNKAIYTLYAEGEFLRYEVNAMDDCDEKRVHAQKLDRIRGGLRLDVRSPNMLERITSIPRAIIFLWMVFMGSALILLLTPLRWIHPFLRKYCNIQNDSLPMNVIVKMHYHLCATAAGIVVKAEGSESMAGPSIAMFSHVSHFDAFALTSSCPTLCQWIGKKELFMVPIFGWSLLAVGGQPISRSNRKRAIKQLDQLKEQYQVHGKSLGISPEGTRSTTGLLREFKKGPFYLWEDTKLPITPACLFGAFELWSPAQRFPTPGVVVVRYGKAIVIGDGKKNGTKGQRGEGGDPTLRETARRTVRTQMLNMLTTKYPKSAGMPLSKLPPNEIAMFAAEYMLVVVFLWMATAIVVVLGSAAFAGWSVLQVSAFCLVFTVVVDGIIYFTL